MEQHVQISKEIHYCWFGGKKLPRAARKCIKSWSKFFPDYEIIQWNENNFDVNSCEYVKKAYEKKKWAFVSDYVRFWVLYQRGGLYFDTDVEVIKGFEDILDKGSFMGCEQISPYRISETLMVAPGLGIGMVPRHPLAEEIVEYYNTIEFDEDNIETVVEHVTRILKKYGFMGEGEIENVKGLYIYPPDYFCPMNPVTGELSITNNTRTIHHYTASWQSTYSRFKTRIIRMIGKDITLKIMETKKRLKKK